MTDHLEQARKTYATVYAEAFKHIDSQEPSKAAYEAVERIHGRDKAIMLHAEMRRGI